MNLLLSFPRTGSTWTRYIIEFFSKKCVEGYYDKKSVHSTIQGNGFETISEIDHKNVFANMVHMSSDIRIIPQKLCMSYRNAAEVIPSYQYSENHTNKSIPIQDWIKNKTPSDFNAKVNQYLSNINYYEKFNGPKMILRYEKLMNNPAEAIKELTLFFGVYDDELLNDFMKNYEEHKKTNLSYKSLPKHMSVNTSGKTNVISDILPDNLKEYFESKFKNIQK